MKVRFRMCVGVMVRVKLYERMRVSDDFIVTIKVKIRERFRVIFSE